MTGNAIFFKALRGISRPVAPSTRPAGAAGLPEPIGRARIGSNSRVIWRMWV